ncbi:hypothetical protein A1O7_01869 [Cladophialophora yegresii CBS 114405]|uniref:HCNGP-like protein n=1 Tax=Cladophialophora yegresii CBS 114405 TaxID=1182544 RepID=W9WC53_9EURO|nr:uncharacterized protein A1O7_01869 [Cladophialophora yegresii CBS 114405]EXJ65528.1 hypothetical protein A1O7_01869 [Cladophialophora yegresii CBS 114405]
MSGLGLVGYGSSDSDDEPPTRGPGPLRASSNNVAEDRKLAANGTTKTREVDTAENGHEAAAKDIDDDGPMVGPTMPEQFDDHEQEQPFEPERRMSERETIHHLTQATHPITSIPPSPPSSPDPALNAKFRRFLELKAKEVHFNEDLANKSTFRNPGILATMISRAGLEERDQYRTSLPVEIFNPGGFPATAYKEELLRNQQSLREQEQATKKTLSAAGKRTIEFASAGTSATSSRESTAELPNKRKRP